MKNLIIQLTDEQYQTLYAFCRFHFVEAYQALKTSSQDDAAEALRVDLSQALEALFPGLTEAVYPDADSQGNNSTAAERTVSTLD